MNKEVRMTYTIREVIENINDIKEYIPDGDESIPYIQIDQKIYTIEEIKLNENKEIILKGEFIQYTGE